MSDFVGKNTLQMKIGKFSCDLSHYLGCGNSSCVYGGKNSDNNELVAIKVIEKKKMRTSIEKLLLEQEIEVLQALKKQKLSNVIQCHEIIDQDDKTCFVMDYCEKGDLNSLIKTEEISEERAQRILKNIIDGYVELNKQQIVHRDIKPENLLIKESGEAFFSDFGFSVQQEQEVKKYSYIVGSPGFLAPQALEEGKFGIKSDIWAIGVLLFVLLEGRTPWKGKNQKDLLSKLKSVPILSQMNKKINSENLINFLKSALTVDLKKRMGISELIEFKEKLTIKNLNDENLLKFGLKVGQSSRESKKKSNTKNKKSAKNFCENEMDNPLKSKKCCSTIIKMKAHQNIQVAPKDIEEVLRKQANVHVFKGRNKQI